MMVCTDQWTALRRGRVLFLCPDSVAYRERRRTPTVAPQNEWHTVCRSGRRTYQIWIDGLQKRAYQNTNHCRGGAQAMGVVMCHEARSRYTRVPP